MRLAYHLLRFFFSAGDVRLMTTLTRLFHSPAAPGAHAHDWHVSTRSQTQALERQRTRGQERVARHSRHVQPSLHETNKLFANPESVNN